MWLIDPEEVLLNVIVLYRFLLLKESVRDALRYKYMYILLSLPDVIIIIDTLYDS